MNYLLKRWNLPSAWGNVFAWGGVASAKGFDLRGSFDGVAATQAGFQAEYETPFVYGRVRPAGNVGHGLHFRARMRRDRSWERLGLVRTLRCAHREQVEP